MQSSSSATATLFERNREPDVLAQRLRSCRGAPIAIEQRDAALALRRARGAGISCNATRDHSRYLGGFSLIEVLAAFVVLALVGTALFRLFSGALGNVALADEYSRATLVAESRLAALGNEAPLREGTDQGTSEDSRFSWTSHVEPYKPPDTNPNLDLAPDTSALRLWRLGVEVRWPGAFGNDRSVALSTVRAAVRELGQ